MLSPYNGTDNSRMSYAYRCLNRQFIDKLYYTYR